MALVVLLYNAVQHRFITAFLHRVAMRTKKQKIAVAVYPFDFWLSASFLALFLRLSMFRRLIGTLRKPLFVFWLCYVEAVLVFE